MSDKGRLAEHDGAAMHSWKQAPSKSTVPAWRRDDRGRRPTTPTPTPASEPVVATCPAVPPERVARALRRWGEGPVLTPAVAPQGQNV